MKYQGQDILVGSRLFLMESGVNLFSTNGQGTNGASEVHVARAGQVLGGILIADVLRPEAKAAVAAMRQMGLKNGSAQRRCPRRCRLGWSRTRCSMRRSENFCQSRRRSGSPNFAQRTAKSRWSVMVLTMLRLWYKYFPQMLNNLGHVQCDNDPRSPSCLILLSRVSAPSG